MPETDPLLDDLSLCACANLRKAARVVTQAYDAALRPAGLKTTQFTLLAVLSRRGAMAISRLAEAMGMDRTTLTRNLGPLLARGLVRASDGADRRVREIAATPAAEALVAEALPLWRRAQARLVTVLGRETLVRLLCDLAATTAVSREG